MLAYEAGDPGSTPGVPTNLENDMSKIHRFKILHAGWEMDNHGHVFEDIKGKRKLFTTSHGNDVVMSKKELLAKIEETRESLEGLLKAKELMKY